MANAALLRCSGRVTKIDARTGLTKPNEDTGEVRDWHMDLLTVLVADTDTVEVSIFRDERVQLPDGSRVLVPKLNPMPRRGQAVDWLVESGSRGGRPSVSFVDTWENATAGEREDQEVLLGSGREQATAPGATTSATTLQRPSPSGGAAASRHGSGAASSGSAAPAPAA